MLLFSIRNYSVFRATWYLKLFAIQNYSVFETIQYSKLFVILVLSGSIRDRPGPSRSVRVHPSLTVNPLNKKRNIAHHPVELRNLEATKTLWRLKKYHGNLRENVLSFN